MIDFPLFLSGSPVISLSLYIYIFLSFSVPSPLSLPLSISLPLSLFHSLSLCTRPDWMIVTQMPRCFLWSKMLKIRFAKHIRYSVCLYKYVHTMHSNVKICLLRWWTKNMTWKTVLRNCNLIEYTKLITTVRYEYLKTTDWPTGENYS